MSDTPITDRLNKNGTAHYMALETARDLERMCAELAEQLKAVYDAEFDYGVWPTEDQLGESLARYEAMKQKGGV